MADIIIYEHINFQGRSQVLPKGRYDDATHQLTLGNDMVSSLKVPVGLVARLYEHYHFQGRFIDIRADTPAISQFWNDRTGSIIVYEKTELPPITQEVMLFEHASYGGKSQILQKGKYDTGDITIGNRILSSALVPTGMVLRLYEQTNFQGFFIEIRGDTPAINKDWNDRTSSIVVDEEAMPSITSWMRLEPHCRNAEMNISLQARIYDPLWMLVRQWQFGEFQGEDNGSPVMARWRGESARLTRYQAGVIKPNTMIEALSYDGESIPLEALVEREVIRPRTNQLVKPEKLRFAAEAGQQFLRLLELQPLSQSYRDFFINKFPFPQLTAEQKIDLDTDSINFLNIVGSRIPDGRRLYDVLHPTSGQKIKLPADLPIATADVAEIEKAAETWVAWCDAFFSEPVGDNPSWSSERMEYALSVATKLSDGECVLTAQEYFDGHLDWPAFDVNAEVSLGAAKDNAIVEISRTAIPAPVSFRGMPAFRFWEFEDAQVDFGSVDAGPTDLTRMLMVEFALAYGNDWFVIPLELDIGSLYRTSSLVITDTFGVRTMIKSSSELGLPYSNWRMFQLSYSRGSSITQPASNLFFLPPALLKNMESTPIEEVLFLRDEMSNLAWGIERTVESPSEQPLNRYEASLEAKQLHEPVLTSQFAQKAGTLYYQLSTDVPEYWIPLLPKRVGQELRLQRGAILKPNGQKEKVSALGAILKSGEELSLFEEEVPRDGVSVTRSYQFTRWTDGSSHLWLGRRKNIGRGEGSSGLRYDLLKKND